MTSPESLKTIPLGLRVVGSFVFRLLCFAAMVWMCLWAELRPAPSLPDALLSQIPYFESVDRYNYFLWAMAYLPVALWLAITHTERFCRYMVSAGLLALIRGLCIMATGLGPVHGTDLNTGMSFDQRWHAFLRIVFHSFASNDGANIYLTKDLFFSGHASTTFLLLLYVWFNVRVRSIMILFHVIVVVSLFLAHLHYTIDVIGAWAVTFTLFAVREFPLRELLGLGQNLNGSPHVPTAH